MSASDRPAPGDLRTLARDMRHSDVAPSAGSTVPLPRFAWKTRILIPGAILLVLLLLLARTAQDVVWPARDGDLFPHLYADLPTRAARDVRLLHSDEGGVPIIPEDERR